MPSYILYTLPDDVTAMPELFCKRESAAHPPDRLFSALGMPKLPALIQIDPRSGPEEITGTSGCSLRRPYGTHRNKNIPHHSQKEVFSFTAIHPMREPSRNRLRRRRVP